RPAPVGAVMARPRAGGAADDAKPAAPPGPLERAASAPAAAEPNLAAASEQDTLAAAPPRGVGPLSPAVRRLIEEHGLEAGAIPASGKGGRLTKDDVLAYLERTGRAAPTEAPAAAEAARPDGADRSPAARPRPAPTAAADGEERVPMTAIRKPIA